MTSLLEHTPTPQLHIAVRLPLETDTMYMEARHRNIDKLAESTAAHSVELAIFHLITIGQPVPLLAMTEFTFVFMPIEDRTETATRSADTQQIQKGPSSMFHLAITIIGLLESLHRRVKLCCL